MIGAEGRNRKKETERGGGMSSPRRAEGEDEEKHRVDDGLFLGEREARRRPVWVRARRCGGTEMRGPAGGQAV